MGLRPFATNNAAAQNDRTSSAWSDACLIRSIREGLCLSLRLPWPPEPRSPSGPGAVGETIVSVEADR
jgi:hypothetical protein